MKRLTNGGKPHICGTPQIHDSGLKDQAYLCPSCFMAVDKPPEKEKLPDWVQRSIARGRITEEEYRIATSKETKDFLKDIEPPENPLADFDVEGFVAQCNTTKITNDDGDSYNQAFEYLCEKLKLHLRSKIQEAFRRGYDAGVDKQIAWKYLTDEEIEKLK